MTKNPHRDYAIATAYLGGATSTKLSEAYGLRPERILAIVRENVDLVRRRDDRDVPVGLPIRTALAIEDAIGIWPTNENALEIARRRMEILRSGVGRRMVMEEIDEWIATASDRKD
jgi:hypothetical protein